MAILTEFSRNMNQEPTPLSDAALNALLTSSSPTITQSALTDRLGARLQTVAGLLAKLPAPPWEPSLIWQAADGSTAVTPVAGTLRVGRSSSCGIVRRDDSGISKQHFAVVLESDGCFVNDGGSTNGTYVNGQLCPGGERRRLLDGDAITAGESVFVFFDGMAGN